LPLGAHFAPGAAFVLIFTIAFAFAFAFVITTKVIIITTKVRNAKQM
jgi:hypothetical protein